MLQMENDFEYKLLNCIIKKKEPVGASSLALKLNTPQATIGRKLHELEFRGFLEKHSNKGRVITLKGQEYFDKLVNDELRKHKVNELVNESNVSSEEDLLDILYVRRLLEKEIACLAAQKITPEECRQLAKILEDQSLEIQQGSLGDKQDLEFHSLLGKISGNKILAQMVNLIMTQSQAYLEFSYIRKKYSTAVMDHEEILKFFVKGDPGAAGKAMVEHSQ
jgi:GntR family transcriptional repressor for pyruvate dehydrogenase complex